MGVKKIVLIMPQAKENIKYNKKSCQKEKRRKCNTMAQKSTLFAIFCRNCAAIVTKVYKFQIYKFTAEKIKKVVEIFPLKFFE
jgi:hypothetical protein